MEIRAGSLKPADSWEPITGANEFIVSLETI
jgi:hypothetical protein